MGSIFFYSIFGSSYSGLVLKSRWSWLLFLFEFIPRSIRNYGYTLFANRRYSWFGQMNSWVVPTQEMRKKFLI